MKKNTKITIYSSSLCGYCYRAKSLLISKKLLEEGMIKLKKIISNYE